jgi:hypothetical protein
MRSAENDCPMPILIAGSRDGDGVTGAHYGDWTVHWTVRSTVGWAPEHLLTLSSCGHTGGEK